MSSDKTPTTMDAGPYASPSPTAILATVVVLAWGLERRDSEAQWLAWDLGVRLRRIMDPERRYFSRIRWWSTKRGEYRRYSPLHRFSVHSSYGCF